MNLLLDIGNTNLRWVRQLGQDLGEVGAVRHGGGVPLDLLAAWESLEAPRRVLLANVGGATVARAVTRVVRALWGLDAETVEVRESCLGLRVAYADPSRLGVDRWLAMLGAQAGQGGAALIVDAGTAVTYDLLLRGGRHLGGLILPGIEVMRSALLGNTQISVGFETDPGLPLAQPWGVDTRAAVGAGGIQALGALADRLHARLAERCRQESGSEPDWDVPRILLTGGDAERLAPAIGQPIQVIPDLVLQGLARLAEGAL
jgi:type III pantothenate kinase